VHLARDCSAGRGGQVRSLDEVLALDGIGAATLAQLRPSVVLAPPNPKQR